MYSTVLLDLDGTVADSARGVINSVIYSLEKCGVTPPERESLYRFIGPPLHDSFADMFGFSPSECDRAVEYYREYYRRRLRGERQPKYVRILPDESTENPS